MIKFLLAILLLSLSSCQLFNQEQKPESVARVGDHYLYKSELLNLVPAGTSKQDSILMVRNYIDRWATQKLLIEAAERNLNESKQNEYNALINQYKIDLYTKAYLEEMVKQKVDTIVSEEDLKKYYKENKENFKANGTLVRMRYIAIDKDNPKLATISDKFFNFNKKDKKFWDTYSLQFKKFAFNDSVWVGIEQVYSKLPVVNPSNRDEVIRVGKKMQILDNQDLYLIKVTDVIDEKQPSPFSYIKPTLKEVIINQRKLELIKKIEKEITDDAIKNKDYEIYK
jgi:hypothetical protein